VGIDMWCIWCCGGILKSVVDVVLNHFSMIQNYIHNTIIIIPSSINSLKLGMRVDIFFVVFLFGFFRNLRRMMGIVLNPYRFKTISIILCSFPFKKLLSTLNLIFIIAYLNNMSSPLILAYFKQYIFILK